MRIYFERTGGFLGNSLVTAVDMTSLSAEEAQSLQQLIDQTQFFELPTDLDGKGMADAFQYTLTVEDTNRKHTVHTSDEAAPDELQPLIRRLTLLARRSPNTGTGSGTDLTQST